MTAFKMSPVLMLFNWFPYHLPNKEYLITVLKIYPFFVLQLISEHFGEDRVILLQRVAK